MGNERRIGGGSCKPNFCSLLLSERVGADDLNRARAFLARERREGCAGLLTNIGDRSTLTGYVRPSTDLGESLQSAR